MNQEKILRGINGDEPKIDGLKVSLGEAIKTKSIGGIEDLENFNQYDEDAEMLVRAALGEDVFERDEKEPGHKTELNIGVPERRINDYEADVAQKLGEIGRDLDCLYQAQFLTIRNGQSVEVDLAKKIVASETEIWDIFHKKYPLLKNVDLSAKLKPIFDKKKAKAQETVENNLI